MKREKYHVCSAHPCARCFDGGHVHAMRACTIEDKKVQWSAPELEMWNNIEAMEAQRQELHTLTCTWKREAPKHNHIIKRMSTLKDHTSLVMY